MGNFLNNNFNNGVHNVLPANEIPKSAAQDSLNWLTELGHIELIRGRQLVGNEGLAGNVNGLWFGYKTDGSSVLFRKAGTAIQYLNGSTWTDIITGLNATDYFTFSNYSSLAGNFVFISGPGGLFKINTANPGNYIDLYDSAKNFKGYSLVDKARMLMWGMANDGTGLYGSYIDAQNATVYTTVSSVTLATGNGSQVTFSGTLAFKGSNPKANMFGLLITAGAITAKDDYLGNITGTGILAGSINYITGDWSITFAVAPANALAITGSYQWENSNVKGITDFTKSATRLAGEGFILRQDEGGDKIMQVLLGIDGNYYSLKRNSAYQYSPDTSDLSPTNEVYRKDIGISSMRAAVATRKGIVFLNTANPEKPQLMILSKSTTGDNILPDQIISHFSFEDYKYDDVVLDTYAQFVVIAAMTQDSTVNNRIFLCDLTNGTNGSGSVDIINYNAKCFARDRGILYAGDVYTFSTYKILFGFDNENYAIDNYWIGKDEDMGIENLKKTRRLRLRGLISPGQWLEIYENFDNTDFVLVGTVRGDGSDVDSSNPGTVGSVLVGNMQVGGESNSIEVYPYYKEIKLKCPKFGERTLMFVAKGIGHVTINSTEDWDNLTFEQRIPKKYRQKQNVSLDGKTTNMPVPEF